MHNGSLSEHTRAPRQRTRCRLTGVAKSVLPPELLSGALGLCALPAVDLSGAGDCLDPGEAAAGA